MRIPQFIKRFIQGDRKRKIVSARAMNELVDTLNALMNIKGQGGIRATLGDSGPVIELTPELQRGLALLGDGIGEHNEQVPVSSGSDPRKGCVMGINQRSRRPEPADKACDQ